MNEFTLTIFGIAFGIAIIAGIIADWSDKKKRIDKNRKIKHIEKANKSTKIQKKQQRMSYHDKIKKGAEYEKFVADQYRAKGYTIWEHGADKGLKDMSIDIVAKRKKELLLIQCKNWNERNKYRINQKDIKALRADARDFVKKNPIFIGYDLELIFTMSGKLLDKGAYIYIKELQSQGKKIRYEIINS